MYMICSIFINESHPKSYTDFFFYACLSALAFFSQVGCRFGDLQHPPVLYLYVYNIMYFLQKDDIMLHFTLTGSSDITDGWYGKILIIINLYRNHKSWPRNDDPTKNIYVRTLYRYLNLRRTNFIPDLTLLKLQRWSILQYDLQKITRSWKYAFGMIWVCF